MSRDQGNQPVKCVIWDLDNTIWQGTLLEGDELVLQPGIEQLLETLDRRGILLSIASRNDPVAAHQKLSEFNLAHYFLYSQIGWNSKASSVAEIGRLLNFSTDVIAFVDDQPFERDEVAHALPDVLCIDAAQIAGIADLPRMNPRFVTEDSRLRRSMYLSDAKRNDAEKTFVGPAEQFLADLDMVFTISRAVEDDLQRLEELTVRTHQLNTTGYTYSYEELDAFRSSPNHLLLLADLTDRYGPYGKIGLCLVECGRDVWTLKLLLMSCRVMSRGVGSLLLNHVMRLAKAAGALLRAEFVSNDRNRMMYVTYKFAGFREIAKNGQVTLLEHSLDHVPDFPAYLTIVDDLSAARPMPPRAQVVAGHLVAVPPPT
jgi:FkbH-like protein